METNYWLQRRIKLYEIYWIESRLIFCDVCGIKSKTSRVYQTQYQKRESFYMNICQYCIGHII